MVGVFRLFASLDFAFVELSGDGSDFHLENRAFPVVGFLVIELGLQADEKVAGEAEAELGTEGEVGADCLFLAYSEPIGE